MTYGDSSVIVKRDYVEPGTDRVRQHLDSTDRVFTSRVTYAEVHAALARKRRERQLSEALYRRVTSEFDLHWPAYDQILVDAATLGEVPRLVRQYALRGYDAIHLAAALWLRGEAGEPVEFWVSDERLEQVARRERLAVVNPEA